MLGMILLLKKIQLFVPVLCLNVYEITKIVLARTIEIRSKQNNRDDHEAFNIVVKNNF